ncbi:neuromedin-U receptor 2-like [Patiria miniata]|uniref:G-protein coupled receptors family 1 profile domain-containing protein n=1 Tax=Patiria miniata TaxID=46514 RepID=A0A913ZMC6_PATMI|nr:neuromedin-U receptor 2-like [Patiria miniata]
MNASNDDEPGNFCSIPDAPILDLSDPSIAARYEYDSVQSALVTIVYPCICLFGILTNSIFLLTVIRVPYMKSITNIYLSNLAVSDIMFLSTAFLTGAGLSLWKYLSKPVTTDFSIFGGVLGCLITQALNSTPFFASTLLVTVVAVERYLAICRPIEHRKINSRGRAFTLIAATWAAAFCCEAFLLPSYSVYTSSCVMWPDDHYFKEFPRTIGSCFTPALWTKVLAAFVLTVPIVFAFIFTFVLYFLIVRKLGKRIGKRAPSEQSSNRAKSRRTRNHVAKMLIIAGTVFYILLTPRTIVILYYYIKFFAGTTGLPPGVEFILVTSTNILLYVNSVTNPIIYVFSNKRYRTAVIQAFYPGSKVITVSH